VSATVLGDVLALSAWAGRVERLAGPGGLDEPVAGVRVQAGLDLDSPVHADEVIAVIGAVSSRDWRLDALIRRAADARARGLLLPFTGPVATSTRLLCERLRLPLFGSDSPLLDLVVQAQVHLREPDLETAGLVLAVHRELAGSPATPAAVVDVLRRLLRGRAALLDRHGVVIEGDIDEVSGLRLDHAVPQRIPVSAGALLAHPVLLPPERAAQLWVVAELADHTFAAAEGLLVAAEAAQRWLLAHRLELERDARSQAALLGDVLRLVGEPSAELRQRLVDIGWRVDGWHVGIRIGVPRGVDVVGQGAEAVAALRGAGVEVSGGGHGNGWTMWTTFDREPGALAVQQLAGRLRRAQRQLQKTVSTHVGVGRPHSGPEGVTRTVAEAQDAARLAAARPESGRFLHVDRLGMAQLLLEWTRTDTFEPAARALLTPLEGQPGDLVRTLAAYLDAESSVAETAAVLGVHRNTAAARITRVEKLLGVDLTDRDVRLALHLACRTILLFPGR
jgi:hypothetical protein